MVATLLIYILTSSSFLEIYHHLIKYFGNRKYDIEIVSRFLHHALDISLLREDVDSSSESGSWSVILDLYTNLPR